jgi:hypothetical protein
MWIYDNEEFTSSMIGDHIGFVYEITDLDNGMKYIGKKKFWSKVTRPPLKGQKRKRKSVKESDWMDYHGSSEQVKSLVEEHGRNRFKREILRLCNSLGEMNYFEMWHQMDRHVLLKPDQYYNAWVMGKIHRNHLKGLIEKSKKD